VGKSKGRRPLGKPKCRWKNIITIYLKYVTCNGVDQIHFIQDMFQ